VSSIKTQANTTETDVTWALPQEGNLFWYAVRAFQIAFQVLKGRASIDR
jgi:hypothetical protein